MRIFYALFRKHMPNGHIFRGKDRLVKPVTKDDLCQLKLEFEIQERNMFLLRHSYLLPEQSSGHAKALGKREIHRKKIICKKKDFYDNVTIESRLGHIRYAEAWE